MTKLMASDEAFWNEVLASVQMIFGIPNADGEKDDERVLQANREFQQLARGQGIDAAGWRLTDRSVVEGPEGESYNFVEGHGLQRLG